jgi:hypothetical protein
MSSTDEKHGISVEHGSSGSDTGTKPVVPVGHGESVKLEGAKTRKVYNAELYAAINDTPIPRWSKESIHLYFCIFVSFCCACANGYDGV